LCLAVLRDGGRRGHPGEFRLKGIDSRLIERIAAGHLVVEEARQSAELSIAKTSGETRQAMNSERHILFRQPPRPTSRRAQGEQVLGAPFTEALAQGLQPIQWHQAIPQSRSK
jgi:hypothetical protein